MSITYEQAMVTLKSMFSGADAAVLHAVLEQNGGHMERTVDMLLQMNIPMGNPSAVPQAAPTPAATPASPKNGPRPTPPASTPPEKAKRATPTPPKSFGDLSQGLPDDFLRPPSYFTKHPQGQHDQRFEEDAQLAQMLQDQLFMDDLMRNPDYYFGGRPHRRHRHHHSNQQQQPQPQPVPQPAPQAGIPEVPADIPAGPPPLPAQQLIDEDAHDAPPPSAHSATFKEKFAKLGEAAKERLRKIAGAFSRNKGPSAGLDYMSLPSLDDSSKPEDIQLNIDDSSGPAIEMQDRGKGKNKAGSHEFSDEL